MPPSATSSLPDKLEDDFAPMHRRRHLIVAIGLASAFAASVWLGGSLARRPAWSVAVPWPALLIGGIMLLLMGAGALAHEVLYWRRPLTRLRHLLEDMRAGRAPINAPADEPGGSRMLLPVLRALLRDLRQARAKIAELEEEMRQRIATRTDALERTIGSLRQQATRDALTGLYNRRMLDSFLPELLERCRTEKRSLCLLAMDIDNFKPLNDTLGHAAGDRLLSELGQLIRSGIREHDAAFRYGGDEFVIVMPDAAAEAGQALASRLGALFDRLSATLHLPRPPRLSIGISTANSPKVDGQELLKLADQALYQTKQLRKTPSTGLQPPAPTLQSPALPKGA